MELELKRRKVILETIGKEILITHNERAIKMVA